MSLSICWKSLYCISICEKHAKKNSLQILQSRIYLWVDSSITYHYGITTATQYSDIWAQNDTFWICFLLDFWSWLLRAFVVLNHIQPVLSLTYVAFLLVHSFAIFITISSKIWHCQNIYAAPKNLSPSMYHNMWHISLTPVHTLCIDIISMYSVVLNSFFMQW